MTNKLREALKDLLQYCPTESDLLDDASLNEGMASPFAIAARKAREALAADEWISVDERLPEKYNELLMAVANKYEGESRHETALRYIKEAESQNKERRA